MKKIFSFILVFSLLILGGCHKDKQFTISFETNSEIEVAEIVLDKGDAIPLIDNPVRLGYDFYGWYLDEELTNPFQPEMEIVENITLYAKWIPHKYAIKFNSNGGSSIESQTVLRDHLVQKPSNPTNGDLIFGGWYLEAGLISPYDFNEPVTRPLTLYARWDVPLLELDEYEAYYIVTSPGEDASKEININYQIKNNKSSVEYTLASDPNYENKTTVYPQTIGFEALDTSLEEPFERRNICKVKLSDLSPNTKYKYRINQGDDTYSDDYYFSTSGGNDTTSFIFMTDVHYYDGYDGAEISDEVIKAGLEIQPNLDFVFTTGDMVDTGGNSIDWDKMFTHTTSFQKLPYLGIPGNHELYEIGKDINQVFRSYFAFPENGYREYRGVSYYFVHNDTLFINLDTNSSYDVGGQVAWLEEVLKNNQSKFIIVGTHAPFFLPENSTDYKPYYIELMERYGVDLVLAGHYHSHRFETLFQGNSPENEYLGVTYLNGAGGGIKSIGTNDPYEFAKGYIIDCLDDRLIIKQINANAEVLKTYEVVNRKLHPKEEATKEELIESITPETDIENNTITFTWSQKFFKNVKEMTIKEAYRDKREELFVFPSPGYVKYTFDKFIPELDSLYIFEITFADGSKETKEFKYNLSGGMNLSTRDINEDNVVITFDPPTDYFATIIREYEVYLNGELFTTFKGTNPSQGYAPVTEALILDLESNTEYHMTVKAISSIGFLYSDEITFATK